MTHNPQFQRGANLMEYVILLMSVAVICIAAVRVFGPTQTPAFENANSGLSGIAPGEGGSQPPPGGGQSGGGNPGDGGGANPWE